MQQAVAELAKELRRLPSSRGKKFSELKRTEMRARQRKSLRELLTNGLFSQVHEQLFETKNS